VQESLSFLMEGVGVLGFISSLVSTVLTLGALGFHEICDPCRSYGSAITGVNTSGNMAHSSRILYVLAVLLATALSAVAHHGSNVSYHTDQTMTIAGTVTEWEFINPHPQIYFDVKTETGEIAHWAAEVLPTPSMMRNMKVGWTRATLKPGDQIVLVCNPSRVAGAKACLAKELKINGKDWPIVPGGAGPGAAKGKQ